MMSSTNRAKILIYGLFILFLLKLVSLKEKYTINYLKGKKKQNQFWKCIESTSVGLEKNAPIFLRFDLIPSARLCELSQRQARNVLVRVEGQF